MKITNETIIQAATLAKAGFSDRQIIDNLKIAKSTFYAKTELMDAVKKARSELRTQVANSLLEKCTVERDTTALIFLSKRLNLFAEDFTVDLSSPAAALSSYEALANSDISLEHKNALRGILSDYMKLYEVVELEKRVKALEDGGVKWEI